MSRLWSQEQLHYLRDVLGISAFLRPPQEGSSAVEVQWTLARGGTGPLMVVCLEPVRAEHDALLSRMLEAIRQPLAPCLAPSQPVSASESPPWDRIRDLHLGRHLLVFGASDIGPLENGDYRGFLLPSLAKLVGEDSIVVERKRRVWSALKELMMELERGQ